MSLPQETTAGGVPCSVVLGWLDAFAAGTLPADAAARARDHLQGCRACAAFGGRYLSLIQALQAPPIPAEASLEARLLARFSPR